MIGWVGLGQCWELVGVLLPVELAAIYDDTAQRGSVTAQELGG